MTSAGTDAPSRDHYQAVVVGSGFGGAVAACRLAQMGIDVAVVERGRRFPPGSFPRDLGRLGSGWLWSRRRPATAGAPALAHGYTAAHEDGQITYIAHELRHVCASLLIASNATDMQVANQMGHSRIETTKNIHGHLFAQDRAFILKAINQAVKPALRQEETCTSGPSARSKAHPAPAPTTTPCAPVASATKPRSASSATASSASSTAASRPAPLYDEQTAWAHHLQSAA